jgi:hypothetical protein
VGKQRSFLAVVTVTLLSLLAPSSASAGGANHIVLAFANEGHPAVIQTDVQWTPVGSSDVSSSNLATALSSNCTGCRAVAVAFQAVIMTGEPNVVTPSNQAVAVNVECTGCDTFAFAYQDVVTTSGPATLSPTGIAELQDVQTRADAIAQSGESDSQMETDLKALAAEFRADVEDNLVLHGPATATATTDTQSTS